MITKEQIENFHAGRELDVLVMEKVFGWRWFQVANTAVLVPPIMAEGWLQDKSLYLPLDHPLSIDSPGGLPREHIDGRYFLIYITPEPYFVSKENHGDILLLINHIVKAHWWLIKSPFNTGELWFAGITPHSTTGWNGRPDFIGSGDTMALAVCKAALMMKFEYLSDGGQV